MRPAALAAAALTLAACGRSEPHRQDVPGPRSPADGALAVTMLNLGEVRWPRQEPDTPETMRIAVLEGTFPFGPQKAFTALIEFDPGVEVPPHSHPTTERITILAGALEFGTGPAADRARARALESGAVMLVPPGQPHWGSIGRSRALLYVHGVGPHNDPRAVDPAAAAPPPPRFDPPLARPVVMNASEIAFAPAPAPLPPGSSMAIVEGDPFRSGAEFTLHLKLPRGARMAAHTHPTHERMVVLSGAVRMTAGERSRELRAGGLALVPAGVAHDLLATRAAVIQLQGLGPLRVDVVGR